MPLDSTAMPHAVSVETTFSYEPLVTGWLVGAWLVLACVSSAHALMYKRDPRSSAIWLLLSFALPVVGPWLYWVIGINRVERRAVRHLGKREQPFNVSPIDPETIELADQACVLGPLRTLYRASKHA